VGLEIELLFDDGCDDEAGESCELLERFVVTSVSTMSSVATTITSTSLLMTGETGLEVEGWEALDVKRRIILVGVVNLESVDVISDSTRSSRLKCKISKDISSRQVSAYLVFDLEASRSLPRRMRFVLACISASTHLIVVSITSMRADCVSCACLCWRLPIINSRFFLELIAAFLDLWVLCWRSMRKIGDCDDVLDC